MGDTYAVIRVTLGNTHAAWPRDGLGGLETFCGLPAAGFVDHTDAPGEGVTCKRCRRSLSSRAQHDTTARRTLALPTD